MFDRRKFIPFRDVAKGKDRRYKYEVGAFQ
jgi:hypothetical protein